MNVYLLNFSKNRRSVAQPNLTGLTPVTCKLKSPSSLLAPVLEFEQAPSLQGSFASLNYVYITEFNRYYYITNIIFNGRLVEVYCAVDELASWKAAINASFQYVTRSASSWNGYIKDGKYPVLAKLPDKSGTYGTQAENPLQPASTTYGVFIVGVVSDDVSISGGVTYYAMTYLTVSTYIKSLFTLATQWGNQGQDLADALKESITDPMQYVTSIMWLPYTVTDFINRGLVGTGVTAIKTGYWNVSITGTAYPYSTSILNLEFTNLVSLSIPNHPQAASRGAYMNMAPFSKYFLSFYPFCGLIELEADLVGGKGGVNCLYTVDLRSGKGVLSVCTEYNGTSYVDWKPKSPIRVIETQIGVNLPLATIHSELTWNPLQYLKNLSAAASSAFGGFDQLIPKTLEKWKLQANIALSPNTDNPNVAANVSEWQKQLDSMPSGADILDQAAAMGSSCEMIGSQGTISLNSRMPIAAWGCFYEAANDDVTKFGRPLCSTVTLSTLSGFVQCDSPVITGSGMTAREAEDIETMLRAGIYL